VASYNPLFRSGKKVGIRWAMCVVAPVLVVVAFYVSQRLDWSPLDVMLTLWAFTIAVVLATVYLNVRYFQYVKGKAGFR